MVNFGILFDLPETTNNAPPLIEVGFVFQLHHGITVVLIKQHKHSWDAVVIKSSHPSYPVGGYHICVSDKELRSTAIYISEDTLP